jgi:RNA polymerase sigma-70 factor, ECF subfamily
MTQQDALATLLPERHKLLALGWSVLGDSHSAEDAYQELLLKVLQRLDEFEGPRHLTAWAWTVMRNRCYEIVRQRNYRSRLLDEAVLDLVDQQLQELDTGDSAARLEALRYCLKQLTNNAQQIVRLRYFDGLQGKEVARRLGRKPEAVYKALQRIYSTLADCVERRLALSS